MISVQTGLKTAKSFGENLVASNFLNAVKTMASSVSPFLSVFGSILSIISSIIGKQSPSPELLAIKQLFETVNARFDYMEIRFNDIENEIHWYQAIAPILICERQVRTLLKRFQDLFQNPPPDVEEQRNILLERYMHHSECSDTLYYSIINDTGIQIGYSTNILREGMVHLANDRTKMRNLMISLVGMMYKAATLDLIFVNFRTPQNYTVMQWTKRFEEIQKKMLQIDNEVVSNWYNQSEKDVQKITSGHMSLSNKDLASFLYHSLSTKYNWRDWLVVVYNPIIGGDAHHVWECGGFFKFRYYHRNLLISSVDKSKPPIDKNRAQIEINSLSRICRSFYEYSRTTVSDAGAIFNWFPPDVKTQCSPFASAGVIGISWNVWYQAPDARFILQDMEICRYHIHLFG